MVNKGTSGDGEPSTEEFSVSKGARRIKSRSLAALGRNVYIFSVGHSPKFNSSHYQLIAVVWDHQEIPLSSVTFKYLQISQSVLPLVPGTSHDSALPSDWLKASDDAPCLRP